MKLYHYTDAAAVQSILMYNKMRLTDMRYLNDSQELRYGADLVQTDIREGRAKHRLSVDYAEQAHEHVLQKLSSLIDAEFNGHPSYSLSFSEEGDLLSQWRAYGAYAIEIDTEKWGQHLTRCRYGLDKAREVTFAPIVDALRSVGRDIRDFAGRVELRGTEGYMDLIKMVAIFKHPGFKEEKEWRLLLDDRAPEARDTKYRARGDMLVPYIEVEMPLECITSIQVGPMKYQEMAFQSMSEFVAQIGRVKSLQQGIRVEKSETPYRVA
ncbi:MULTISPECIES: DUF2971 domain-containing protein [unclassified Pseudomonas]|uniref:DUF2971 domain-containing protein n=1 Tax=unclassified Pseudomonas TaxID=196821 RepID=UPI00111475F4|nr:MULTISPECIES: DUF2971 domain-containing protein [unclassified Pseudomonas]NHC51502.1 hypothetical protein [Pseudomonas sp. AU8050]